MPARTSAPLNVVDLFAGCGGFTQGFHSYEPPSGGPSPFKTVAAVEFDQAAAATYASNFGEEVVFPGDIKKWDPTPHIGNVDVILGGPPCQGFSGLGKEDPKDPRNQLWREYVKVVSALEPKVFVIENVDRFFRSAEYQALLRSKKNGLLRKYNLSEGILNSADYGVPQARKRAIVIATRRDLPMIEIPTPTHTKHRIDRELALFDHPGGTWETIDEIFAETTKMELSTLPERKTELFNREFPGVFLTSELHLRRNPTALSLARYRAIGPGGNRNDLRGKTALIEGEVVDLSTESWDRHNKGSGDVMGRLRLGAPSVTIRTEFFKPEKGRYLHPSANRPITHYEAARIQGFPETFKWCGTKVQIARQIGNAVPIGLSAALAKHLHNHLSRVAQHR
ncbi:DNA cytosine methyltransferase [Streptomyces sp. NBC_00454]|uniref:DNA cytosine methyltransferase n=1 Tax=Streptomyces sp. NBC_00454 TaxID=2975747 RepID=UPI0030E26653